MFLALFLQQGLLGASPLTLTVYARSHVASHWYMCTIPLAHFLRGQARTAKPQAPGHKTLVGYGNYLRTPLSVGIRILINKLFKIHVAGGSNPR